MAEEDPKGASKINTREREKEREREREREKGRDRNRERETDRQTEDCELLHGYWLRKIPRVLRS